MVVERTKIFNVNLKKINFLNFWVLKKYFDFDQKSCLYYCEKGSKTMILWLFLKKNENCMIMENFEKNDLLQIVSIKNPYYSKFYADFNAKKRFWFQPFNFEI